MPQARTLIVIAFVSLLGGCATASKVMPGHSAKVAALLDPAWRAEDYNYRIGPGDELGVRFPVNAEMDTQVTVGPDGRAVFPYLLPVRVAGLTVEQANAQVTARYKNVLRVPTTLLSIFNYGGGQIYIAGEVKNPGAKTIRGDYTVLRAVFDAGGFEPTAKTGKVVLLRRRPTDGKVLIREINARGALKAEEGADMNVLPGDVIFVPRSTIAEIDRIVQQYVTNALPFNLNYNLNPQLDGTVNNN